MNIRKLKFYHFRNYDKASFSFEENGIHILRGNNAQGKTNVVEAIYFLSLLRSFRTSKLNLMIKHDEEMMMIEAQIESKERTEDLKVVLSEHKKQLFRFGQPVSTYSSFVGSLNAILFCPDDLMLFAGAPSQRRKFIDTELIKLSKTYTATLSHYQKLLKDRNLALKSTPVDRALIQVYTDQMIEDEKIIIKQRHAFLKDLIEKSQSLYPFFDDGKEVMDAVYKTFVPIDENLEQSLKEAYATSLSKDLFYKTTQLGIHKDDFIFSLNGVPVIESASQGQKRSVLLSLKLGLAHIVYEKDGQYPILLLDDVFSELDEGRKRTLIQMLPEQMQIFITSAEPIQTDWFKRKVFFYTIENGTIKEEVHERNE